MGTFGPSRLPKRCFPSGSLTGRDRAKYIERYRDQTFDILTLSIEPLELQKESHPDGQAPLSC